MTETYVRIKDALFASALPHFTEALQEKWQMAIMLRRKYLDPPDIPADELYARVIDDLHTICEAYDYDDTLVNLLLEVYDDISRQIDPAHRDSRIRMLMERIKRDEKHQSDSTRSNP